MVRAFEVKCWFGSWKLVCWLAFLAGIGVGAGAGVGAEAGARVVVMLCCADAGKI